MKHNEIIEILDRENIDVIEMPLGRTKGLYGDNVIAINSNLRTTSEKISVIAEELGHHYTSSGDILNQKNTRNRKQERRARAWGYKRLIGIIDLVNAFNEGIRNRYELSEYLGVTEKFIEDGIKYYKEKYGPCYMIDNYIVYFEPLIVVKRF